MGFHRPAFWRALTDNDRGSSFHLKSGNWLAADMFIKCKDVEVIMDGVAQGKTCAPDNNRYGGDVYANEMKVDVHYFGAEGLPELPVFGMRFVMPTVADRYVYDGLSGETYPDRKKGAQSGIFFVDDLSLTPYTYMRLLKWFIKR